MIELAIRSVLSGILHEDRWWCRTSALSTMNERLREPSRCGWSKHGQSGEGMIGNKIKHNSDQNWDRRRNKDNANSYKERGQAAYVLANFADGRQLLLGAAGNLAQVSK
jgi:hypothetical protein